MVGRRGTCETCKNKRDGVGCGKYCDSEYSGWEAKKPPCKTCAKYPGEGVYCGAQGDCWEAKTAITEEPEIREKAPCDKCAYEEDGKPFFPIHCSECLQTKGYPGFALKEPDHVDQQVADLFFKKPSKNPENTCKNCGYFSNVVGCVGMIGVCVSHSAWKPVSEETPLSDTQKKISEICDEVKNILLEKNRKYGDSALNPKRVFSNASPIEQINVRIDDKISRIMSAQDDDTEDAELDLIGYLILKRVAKRVQEGL